MTYVRAKKRIKKVVIGGTFDVLHKGHELLFKKAFGLGLEFSRSENKGGGRRNFVSSSPSLCSGDEGKLRRRQTSSTRVTIGLTSNKMAEAFKKRRVKDFKKRKKELENFIKKEFSGKYRIIKIEDKFGPTLKEDFDYIVVSPETYKTAMLINKKRQKIKKKPIKIIKIKLILAEDKKPISASRILKGIINEQGKLICLPDSFFSQA